MQGGVAGRTCMILHLTLMNPRGARGRSPPANGVNGTPRLRPASGALGQLSLKKVKGRQEARQRWKHRTTPEEPEADHGQSKDGQSLKSASRATASDGQTLKQGPEGWAHASIGEKNDPTRP